MKLLYLHGFRSTAQSAKAQLCLEHVEKLRRQGDCIEWYCPQLPPSPRQAMSEVMAHIEDWQGHQMGVIGSSLGGFYATYVAEHKRCGAVLLNPVVDPAHEMQTYCEQHRDMPSEDRNTYFQAEFVDELRALEVPVTMPERYFVITAKGDELLDYRKAVRHYRGGEIKVLEGSDHHLSGFSSEIQEVFDFLGLGQ